MIAYSCDGVSQGLTVRSVCCHGVGRWEDEVGRLQARVRQMEAQVERANDELDTSQNR